MILQYILSKLISFIYYYITYLMESNEKVFLLDCDYYFRIQEVNTGRNFY